MLFSSFAKKSPLIPLFQSGNLLKDYFPSLKKRSQGRFCTIVTLCVILSFSLLRAGEPQGEWEKTLAAAKKEGNVVVGIPASSELRTAIGAKFKEKFGVPVELLSARGPENVTRIITEFNAGVRYFDILVAGGATPLSMVAAGAADDFQSYKIGGAATSGRTMSAANGRSMPFFATRARPGGTIALRPKRARLAPSTICSIPSGKAESDFSIHAIRAQDKIRGLSFGRSREKNFLVGSLSKSCSSIKICVSSQTRWQKANSRLLSALVTTPSVPSSRRGCRWDRLPGLKRARTPTTVAALSRW
jgi:hypothetical protein